MGSHCENILVIKLRYIGDVLLTTPLFPVLREHFPHTRLTVLVNQGTELLLKGHPAVDQIIVLPRGHWFQQIYFLQALRLCRFDCVIDLSDGDRSAFLTALSGAGIRIGFNHESRWRGKVYSWSFEGSYGTRHMVDYHAQALVPLGIEPHVGLPVLHISDEEQQGADQILAVHGLNELKWVMLHPAARYWFKAWPPERFAALGDVFVEEGFSVVLVGSEHEHGVADTVRQAAQYTFISLVGKTSLRELAALMTRCHLFVGNDAGPMHMAAAAGCPVVALFGPTDPVVWGPQGTHCHAISKGVDCRECFHPGCFRGEMSCMKQIVLEEVVEAAMALLSQER